MLKLIIIISFLASISFAKQYEAVITKVIDGDTVTARINLGLDVLKTETIRLYGIDAPEMKTEEGKKAHKFLDKLMNGKGVLIDNLNDRREKYGRLLCKVSVDGKDVGETIVKAGFARQYFGGVR